MTNRLTRIAIHVAGCLLFLALPYFFAENGFAKLRELGTNAHERRTALSYLLTIGFFYVNYYLLIPRLFFSRQYVLFAFSALGCFLTIESVLVTVNRQNGNRPPMQQPPDQVPMEQPPPPDRGGPPFPGRDRPPGPPPGQFRQMPANQPGLPSELSQTFFLTTVGLLLALAIRANNRWRETERDRLRTELAYLKAQINPHFLFNTLNSIYSLAIIESPPTADALVKLSSFLRYVIQESQKDQVSLASELDYIGHYVALQRLRVDESVQIDYHVTGRPNGWQVAPLLLISFVENAFKYGVSPEESSVIDIRIGLTDGELRCHVFNRKVRVFEPTAIASGIGLTNTKARLRLLYPDRHTLVITDKPDSFTVDLAIMLS